MENNKPTPGYYRGLLPKGKERMRIADMTRPELVRGVTFLPDAERDAMAAHFAALTDPWGAYYAEGLRTGRMALIYPWPPAHDGGRVWAPGELFLRS